MSRPPHEYYEMLARSSGTPLDPPPSIPFPSNQINHRALYESLAGPQSQPIDQNLHRNAMPMMTPPQGFSQHHQPPYPNFINPGQYPAQVGPPSFQMYSNQSNFSDHQMILPRGPSEGAPRGPPRADPRLQFPSAPQHPMAAQQHHPNSSTQDPLLQLFHNAQQRQSSQAPLPMQSPNLSQQAMPMPMRSETEDRTRMGIHNLPDRNQSNREHSAMFQQMAVTTAGSETSGRTGYPKSEMMTSSDVRFVVTKVVQHLESNDPYSDDYYFLQVRMYTHFEYMANKCWHSLE